MPERTAQVSDDAQASMCFVTFDDVQDELERRARRVNILHAKFTGLVDATQHYLRYLTKLHDPITDAKLIDVYSRAGDVPLLRITVEGDSLQFRVLPNGRLLIESTEFALEVDDYEPEGPRSGSQRVRFIISPEGNVRRTFDLDEVLLRFLNYVIK